MRVLACLALVAAVACAPQAPVPTRPANATDLPPMRLFAGAAQPGPTRSNTEIARDFLDLSFALESGRALPVLTRFDGPVAVRVTGQVPPTLGQDLAALLARLRAEAGIDIRRTDGAQAQITIEAVPRAAMLRAVPRASCFVVPRVAGWDEFLRARRSATIDWTTLDRRDRATIIVPSDAAPQEIRDCLHEELSQALGPLNDLYSLPDSVFNDDNIHGVLTGFDMLVLRLYNAPGLANGMTRQEVAARLPGLLAALNPAGQRQAGGDNALTPDSWRAAIETALAPGRPAAVRQEAASRAVGIARGAGWTGARRGFSHYAYGRLLAPDDPDRALDQFAQAQAIWRSRPETRVHTAFVAVQLGAFALAAGDARAVLALTEAAIPVARSHENAALMATLMMLRAEALDLGGRPAEAAAQRLDSLGWARYGFGSDGEVRDRLREIRDLTPLPQG